MGSTRFVAFETLAWHNECFFCAICKNSMVGKGFIQVMPGWLSKPDRALLKKDCNFNTSEDRYGLVFIKGTYIAFT